MSFLRPGRREQHERGEDGKQSHGEFSFSPLVAALYCTGKSVVIESPTQTSGALN
jgi:hypothetical protein